MNKICIFAGTTEGRALAHLLTGHGLAVYACVATEYGQIVLEEAENLTVSAGRLDQQEMAALFTRERFDCVVDATHPYAPVVTANLQAACRETGTEYLRLLREESQLPQDCVYAADTAEAVEILKTLPGNILLTTGSKELHAYAALPDFAQRVYARVLPVESSLAACRDCGLPASHILAMQGPFSAELNIALLHSLQASVLVTKEAGSKGGFPEKAEAARQTGAVLLVIGRPAQTEGMIFSQIAALFERRYGFRTAPQVTVVGIGPGGPEGRTVQAERAIGEADCLIGAKRMLEACARENQTCCQAIEPEKIRDAVFAHPECRRFAVLMAGDVGFYSGTKKLLPLLADCKTEVVPGLSSLAVLCSRARTSYEDVVCVSLHGRQAGIANLVSQHKKVFALVGGEDGMEALCRRLTEYHLENAMVTVGERLGYPEEKITAGTAEALSAMTFDKLSAALIENPDAALASAGMPDEAFQRGSRADGSPVPMTKREIRASAMSRLALNADSVCWDIGAGTGSVSIEMALKASRGWVYAVEKKEEALKLLAENSRRWHADNITAVAGLAPDCCRELPAPTHVFIGGSSGNMGEIIALAREKNPKVRIVAAAVALETVSELTALSGEAACITAAQAKKIGPYTLMQGQNPVYLFTFGG